MRGMRSKDLKDEGKNEGGIVVATFNHFSTRDVGEELRDYERRKLVENGNAGLLARVKRFFRRKT